jgi:hypothetical protein
METKPKKELSPEQIEELKQRLLKAREAKLNRKRIDYVQKKEEIKEEGLKKRTLKKIKTLVDKGAVKEEELMVYLPKKEGAKQIPADKIVEELTTEIPFEQPLPTKPIPKTKPQKQPDCISFEEPLPEPKIARSKPIDIIPKKDKDRFMKLVYYKEPSKKTLKRLEKLQESSSSGSESESEEETANTEQTRKPQIDENAFYKNLAMKYYG